MIIIVTDVAITAFGSSTSTVSSFSMAIGVIVLLVVLMIGKELLSTYDVRRSAAWRQALNMAIAPLVLTFGLIAMVRLAELLRSR